MSKTLKIAFIGYLFIAAIMAGNGIFYLTANKIMPFHLAAMNSTWEKLTPGVQVMSLNFMKAAAAGMVTTSIAICFLLFKPFRRGEYWSRWALLIVSLNEIILLGWRVINVRNNTAAELPLIPIIVMAVFAVVSFILSIFSQDTQN